MSAGALPGFRDFYPAEFAQRSWIFERWREVAVSFGYQEYDGPPLEPLDLYTRKLITYEEAMGHATEPDELRPLLGAPRRSA